MARKSVAVAEMLENPTNVEELVSEEPTNPDQEILKRDVSAEQGDPVPEHEYATMFPPMLPSEYNDLKLDIAKNGLLVPIYLADGQIVDGRHRYRACRELGIEPKFENWDGKGSLAHFVIALNLNRRHLTTSQKANVAVKMLPMFEKEAKERQLAGVKLSDAELEELDKNERTSAGQVARVLGISGRSVATAKKLAEIAPDLSDAVSEGKMSLNKALAQANERPNADGTPRIPVAREPKKPPMEERAGSALGELLDSLESWVREYGRIPQLKAVTAKVRPLINDVKVLYEAGLDEGIDIDSEEFADQMDAMEEETADVGE